MHACLTALPPLPGWVVVINNAYLTRARRGQGGGKSRVENWRATTWRRMTSSNFASMNKTWGDTIHTTSTVCPCLTPRTGDGEPTSALRIAWDDRSMAVPPHCKEVHTHAHTCNLNFLPCKRPPPSPTTILYYIVVILLSCAQFLFPPGSEVTRAERDLGRRRRPGRAGEGGQDLIVEFMNQLSHVFMADRGEAETEREMHETGNFRVGYHFSR